MADLWQQNGILIGVALVLAVLLLLVLLGKGRRKVQIEREETPADTSVKRNQALIDLPPAASGIAPPAIASQEPAAPAPAATAPVAKPAAAAAEPASPQAATIGAGAEPAAPASPQTGSIVAPMPAPDPVHDSAVVVKTAPRPVEEPAAAAALSAMPAAAPAAPSAEGDAPPAAHAPTPPSPAPASGGSDELTRIKGLGPKLAETLQALGVVSFAQIASWDDSTIDRIDDQLGRFKGRIRRDNWVEQARLLAQGNIAGYEDRFGKI